MRPVDVVRPHPVGTCRIRIAVWRRGFHAAGMKPIAIALSTALLNVALLAASVKTDVKFDRSAKLDAPHTYTWLDSPEYVTNVAPDVLRDERLEKAALDAPIRDAIDRELSAHQWRRVGADQSPEFQVVYYVFLSTGAQASMLGDFYQYTTGWQVYSDAGRPTSYVTVVEKGTLVVDLIDPARKSAVWRGTASGDLDRTRSQDKRVAIIADGIKRLFRKFPPK
jgi:Domain of unknown function (DUF4136)